MLIKQWMSKHVTTLNHQANVNDAARLFETRVISMLPVLKDEELVGIVTDGDIRNVSLSEDTKIRESLEITSVMSSPVITIPSDRTVTEAAETMLRHSIAGLPVLEKDGRIGGVISKGDIFRCYVSFTGVGNEGQVFAFRLLDKPGIVKNISNIIQKSGGRLSSILTSFDETEPRFRVVFIHAYNLKPEKFENLRTKFYHSGELYYAADMCQGLRNIY
ncbi:MAG: acetoin utilization protein AcuB [Desulforhopalus sp.]|jgi:acetoin utilization protein AcuB